MKKFLLYMFGIGAAIIGLGVAIVLILTYWEKLLSYASAGARVATNVLNQFTGDTIDKDDPDDYYDI
ncbi:MAG: hypothetical protein LBS85_03775 [Clostridiales Family XIII bacterium]|jgi:hypothetical protein|nr:hypothetical protein [Clostridiales Family XIII bacterium]